MSAITIFYQCDPEYRITQELNNYISETRLENRNINTKDLFVQGHPLFTLGSNENPSDTYFPKIGVEWDTDEPEDDLGWNYHVREFTPRIKEKIAHYISRGRYEQVSHHTFDDILSIDEKYIETHTRRVVSEVLITGWSSGGATSKKENQFLYMATDAILPYVQMAMQSKYGVAFLPNGKPQLNIVSNQSSDVRHGFEIPMKVVQLKIVYRMVDSTTNLTPDYYRWGKVKDADIYLEKSRSKLNYNYTKRNI